MLSCNNNIDGIGDLLNDGWQYINYNKNNDVNNVLKVLMTYRNHLFNKDGITDVWWF